MCRHVECPFYCVSSDSCDYMLTTGKPRGVPSDKCTKYKTGFTGDDRPLGSRYIPIGFREDTIAKFEKAYKPGMTATELARKANGTKSWALRWLRRAHPESESLKDVPWRW